MVVVDLVHVCDPTIGWLFFGYINNYSSSGYAQLFFKRMRTRPMECNLLVMKLVWSKTREKIKKKITYLVLCSQLDPLPLCLV